MPKLTITGKELGASETGAIVLDETAFNTNQEVLEKHRDAINGVERIENFRYPKALRRGNHFDRHKQSFPNLTQHKSSDDVSGLTTLV